MKSSGLIVFVVVAFLIALLAGCEADVEQVPPNIILLMGDDHGWEETGYNGHPHVLTPVLDEMAASGLRFDRFYAAHPSCSPTRGSVLTGRHPNRYGTFTPNHSLRPEEVTVAHILGEAGYLRGHFGKWHVGTVKADSPVNPGAMGFDEWLSHDNFFELNPILSPNGGPPEMYPGESSEVLVDKTIKFIEEANEQGKPFFAVVWFGSPHEPYSGLTEDLLLYEDLPALYADKDSVRLTSNETGLPVTRPLGEVLRERYAEITAMDRSIGTLRSFLERNGLQENTILWYKSDNGTPTSGVLASPLRGRKGQVYDGGTRVPAVIEWPAVITEPQSSSVHAVTSDILPTLAAIANVDLPEHRPLDGINLTPVLEGNLASRPAPIFFWDFRSQHKQQTGSEPWIAPEWQEGTTPLVKLMNGVATRNFRNFHHPEITLNDYLGPRAMLGNQYKLVIHDRDTPDESTVELFDMSADPSESTDIAVDHVDVVEAMQRELEDWQASVLESLMGKDYD